MAHTFVNDKYPQSWLAPVNNLFSPTPSPLLLLLYESVHFRLIVLTESRQFVLGLPRLHQLVRPSMEKSEVQRQRTIFPYGDGSQALAVRALDERLSIYQLPSVTLLQQVKLPGRLLSSEVSYDIFSRFI